MLGSVERGQVLGVLDALAAGDGQALMAEATRIASFSPDFGTVLDDLAAALHRIQLIQLVPGYRPESHDGEDSVLVGLAERLAAEDVQLYYQIATTGRRDLALAPDARTGFEMALLRMLAFRPSDEAAPAPSGGQRSAPPPQRPVPVTPSAPAAPTVQQSTRPAPAPYPAPKQDAVAPVAAPRIADAGGLPDWEALIQRADLRGPLGQLAQNSALRGRDGNTLILALQPTHMHLAVEPMVSQIADRVSEVMGEPIRLRFIGDSQGAVHTPAARAASARSAAQSAAEESIEGDPLVQALKREFGARVVPQSIKPFES
jgi:DNA polymerase-3 subunit gamma/tau